MSQLNLKQILSGDNLSSVVDKLNYNFDQIILNGGGPQGLRGNLGSPGLPGAQGLRGFTGPTGEHGTYLYAEAGVGPTAYFANGGLPPSRIGDVYMDTYPTHLDIYELGATGWSTIEVMTLPGGYWKSVVDNGTLLSPSPATTSAVNDTLLAEKMLITSAIGASAYIINPSVNPGELIPELTASYLSTVMIGSVGNQLRLLSPDLTGTTHSTNWSTSNDIYFNQGGIIHSLEKAPNGAVDVQMYRILNGDLYGDKYFSLNLNGGKVGTMGVSPTGVPDKKINNSILYGDPNNRAGSGIDHYVPLKAQFNIQDSLIVGDSSFYNYNNHVLYHDQGIISQGNLSIGARNNSYYTGAFLGLENSGSIAIDVYSDLATYRESSLTIGTDIFAGKGSIWKFTTNAQSAFWNDKFGSMTLGGQLCLNPNTAGPYTFTSYDNTMYFGLTHSIGISNFGPRPIIGVANNDPKSLFEVGAWKNRISIGEMGGSGNSYDGSNYIGFNMHRNPSINNWFRRGTGGYNAGKSIWTGNNNTGLHFSFTPSTGGSDTTGLNDGDMTANTRASIMSTGAFWNNLNSPALEGVAGNLLGLYIGFGATGVSGDMPYDSSGVTPGQTFYRRPAGYFGQWGTIGNPVIHSMAGLTQSVYTVGDGPSGVRNVLPQYSFYGASDCGLYAADSDNSYSGGWGTEPASAGIAVGGMPALAVQGNFIMGGRVGISTRKISERLQIGDRMTFHDGGRKFFGHNIYYDNTSGVNSERRLFGQPGGYLEGYAKTQYIDWGYTAPVNVSRFSNVGTKIAFEVGNPGDTTELLKITNNPTSPNLRNYRGVMISPPLIGTSGTFFNSATHVPQVAIGIKLDTIDFAVGSTSTTPDYSPDSSTTARRGTLAIAAQMRHKPYAQGIAGMTTEDYYNIGLYSYDGFPVAGIQAAGGNPATYTTRSLSLNLIGNSGNAIYEDLSVLYSESDINLTNEYQRRSWFGDSFRIGINEVPQFLNGPVNISKLKSGFGHDVSSLVASGATAFYSTGSAAPAYHPASIHKGSLIVDQTPFNNGGGSVEGIWIKDGAIISTSGQQIVSVAQSPGGIGSRAGVLSSDTYAGDWNIRYKSITSAMAGLSIGKPTGTGNAVTSDILYLDDTGNVGIGTTTFQYTTGKIWNSTGAAGTWVASPWGSQGAKLSVSGNVRCDGILQSSDARLKNSINSLDSTIEKIKLLNPVDYEFNDTPGIASKGFIAQEILEIYPEIVRVFNDPELEGGKLSLDYNSFIPILTKGIQEQQEIIEKQAETIKNLESKLSKIEELLERNNIS